MQPHVAPVDLRPNDYGLIRQQRAYRSHLIDNIADFDELRPDR
jgi:hypothetical protein